MYTPLNGTYGVKEHYSYVANVIRVKKYNVINYLSNKNVPTPNMVYILLFTVVFWG